MRTQTIRNPARRQRTAKEKWFGVHVSVTSELKNIPFIVPLGFAIPVGNTTTLKTDSEQLKEDLSMPFQNGNIAQVGAAEPSIHMPARGHMISTVVCWRCKCGVRLKAITEREKARINDNARLEVACPKCGDTQLVYAHHIVEVTADTHDLV